VVIRFASPEDFRVEEIPLYAPSGSGEHTFVRIEKVGRTTEDVARELARAAGVAPRDVGYAGRKDRVAIAIQWFSVPRLAPEAALALRLPGARVLEAASHPHKLRTGQLRGNRFDLRLRGLDAEALRRAERRCSGLVARGLPNRFGMQRFGREGDNAREAQRMLAGGWRPRDRRHARFLVSALQAEVFNAVLDERGDAFDRVEAGDVAVVHASGGLFVVEDAEREAPRAAAFEISATGPMFGSRAIQPRGAVAEREFARLAEFGIDDAALAGLRGVTVRGGRRALRVRPEELTFEPDPDGARLRCVLPPGSYATVLVETLVSEALG
jgi:tRNA pseudouridine13 synthase